MQRSPEYSLRARRRSPRCTDRARNTYSTIGCRRFQRQIHFEQGQEAKPETIIDVGHSQQPSREAAVRAGIATTRTRAKTRDNMMLSEPPVTGSVPCRHCCCSSSRDRAANRAHCRLVRFEQPQRSRCCLLSMISLESCNLPATAPAVVTSRCGLPRCPLCLVGMGTLRRCARLSHQLPALKRLLVQCA